MQENPYSAMLNTLRKDARQRQVSPWRMGEVVSVEPLVIETGGQQLQGDDLWVNYQLRENREPVTLEEIAGTLYGSVDCPSGGISMMNVSSGALDAAGIFGGVLHQGDRVVLLQSGDGQQFVVLCKVVKA